MKDYNLCEECCGFIVGQNKEFEFLWPSFLWKVLSHGHQPKFGRFYYYHDIYPGEHLWQIIPLSMRNWWLASVQSINRFEVSPYSECSLTSPPSIFRDRTTLLYQFEEDKSSGELSRLISMLNNEEMLMPNILCPFGCTDYCHRAEYAEWDLIIQQMLKKIVLPKCSENRSETNHHNFSSMWAQYFRDPDDYDCVMFNPDWKITPTIIFTANGPKVLTCRHHGGGIDKLRLYPPRPNGHNLSAEQSDQLAHVVGTPRIARPLKARYNNTSFAMTRQIGGYNGFDTMNVSTHSDWSKTSCLLAEHESNGLAMHPDLVHLLSCKVRAGQVSTLLSNNLMETSLQLASKEDLNGYCQGATFVPFYDVILLHLQQTSNDFGSGSISCINDKGENITCRPSWAPTINYVQTEDCTGYGSQFRPVPNLASKPKASMMAWTLCSLLSSVKELWQAVATKEGLFHYNSWEGHVLGFIQSKVFSFHTIWTDQKSPFTKISLNGDLIDRVNCHAPVQANVDVDQPDPNTFFEFSIDFMRSIFKEVNHSTIAIEPSLMDIVFSQDQSKYDDKNIIIIVGDDLPEMVRDEVNLSSGVTLELRSIVLLRSDLRPLNSNASSFNSIRYMRHGHCFKSFWKQEREDKYVTQCHGNILDQITRDEDAESNDFFFQHVLCYVKKSTPNIDKWRLKIFETLGGKTHVQCACNRFPLIPTAATKGSKKKCIKCHRLESMVCCSRDCTLRLCRACYRSYPTHTVTVLNPTTIVTNQAMPRTNEHIASDDDDHADDEDQDDGDDVDGEGNSDNGNHDECGDDGNSGNPCNSDTCDDDYIGNDTNFDCHDTVIDNDDINCANNKWNDACNDFEVFMSDHEVGLREYDSGEDSINAEDSDSLLTPRSMIESDDGNDDEPPNLIPRHDDLVHEEDNDHDSFAPDDEDDIPGASENAVIFQDYDNSQERTEDNIAYSDGFISTLAGDRPIAVEQNPDMDRVSGHVLYNQAAVCTRRFESRITGTQVQQNFVQKFAATTDGEACPLLSLEQCLHPRIFYAKAEGDAAILGAMPIWLYSPTTFVNGFAPLYDINRSRLTASGSLTSTCPHYLRFVHDVFTNKALSTAHSSQVLERGFQVDTSNNIGLSIRNSSQNGLTENVDSYDMVRGLSASQEYVKFMWFITFTCNHSETPGVQFLHHWKKSGNWKCFFPGFDYKSEIDKAEITRAIDEASGPIFLRNWVEVRTLILQYLRDHESFLGENLAIFSRDEYQSESGNLFHEHMVFAILRRLDAETERRLFDLIRSSVFEVIKPDDIEPLINKGLLKSVDHAHEIVDKARRYLSHHCGPRCLIRIGPGDGPENFRCKKIHPVRDSPNPTEHQFIQMKFPYSPGCIDALEKCGLAEVIAEHEIEFKHAYFCSTRHMPPCNQNATCNMSPVLTELFILFLSMVNVQAIGQASGIAKYILKYVAKFDQSNRVAASANTRTGALKIGSQFLHNTKITTSAINEDKAHKKQRNKHHFSYRDIPMMEIYQLMIHLSEVTTNLVFIQISTRSFELRSRSKIKLNSKGKVCRPDQRPESNRQDVLDDDYNDDDDGDNGNPSGGIQFGPNSDAHISGICSVRVRENEQLGLRVHQHLTPNQIAIVRDHKSTSRQYDMISVFGLRPPELLPVFQNPKHYFRMCYISTDNIDGCDDDMKNALSRDLKKCLWIDCLGRSISLRRSALDEAVLLVEQNLRDQTETERQMNFHINETILELIRVYMINDEDLSADELSWKKSTISHLIHDDEVSLPPVPVMSNPSPYSSHDFYVHIILSLGSYETEIDVLQHGTPRECLRKARLIGPNNDEESLYRYANELLHKYIVEQLVFYPNSLRKSDGWIVMASRVFEDIIVHDEFTANEIPFTMTELLNNTEQDHHRFWNEMKESQLTSVFTTLRGIPNLPTREDILNSTRDLPFSWDPVQTMVQSDSQNEASINEQKLAMKTYAYSIDKYRGSVGPLMTHTKCVIVHGAPGSGKSFVGERGVLYSLSQGLRTCSTTLTGIRANAIGGKHIHKLFMLPTKGGTSHPFRSAMSAIQSIKNNKTNMHVLLTVDVIFLDEAGQISAEQLATIDIILRKLRRSSLPFGGILIIGTMDHTQTQPINAMPFLMSTLMLTSFTFVKLNESVRASEDAPFREFQQLTRTNPYVLRENLEMKARFLELAGNIFEYVDSFDDPKIRKNMSLVFARKSKVKNATALHVESLISNLRANDDNEYYIRHSIDSQVRGSSRSEWSNASQITKRSLNNQLKEPETLVLMPWGIYEITTNASDSSYNQSCLAILVDMPPESDLDKFGSFSIWVAPPGTQYIDFLDDDDDGNDRPTKDQLKAMQWKEVTIGTAMESAKPCPGGYQGKRKQYSLKHIGACTINKSQGQTIPQGLAVEISSNETCPWEKEQVVVVFSRTKTSSSTIIVGDKSFVLRKLWELVTTANQWTLMMENVLDILTINADHDPFIPRSIEYRSNYPFDMCHVPIPSDSTGYIYLLVSHRNKDFSYIGETQNFNQRFSNHQSGNGAIGTANPEHRPFHPAGIITGGGKLSEKPFRLYLEAAWRQARNELLDDNIFNILNAGETLVHHQNNVAIRNDTPDRLTFTKLICPRHQTI